MSWNIDSTLERSLGRSCYTLKPCVFISWQNPRCRQIPWPLLALDFSLSIVLHCKLIQKKTSAPQNISTAVQCFPTYAYDVARQDLGVVGKGAEVQECSEAGTRALRCPQGPPSRHFPEGFIWRDDHGAGRGREAPPQHRQPQSF